MESEHDLFESAMCDQDYEPDGEELQAMVEREREDEEKAVRDHAEEEIDWAELQHDVVLSADKRLAAIESISACAKVDPQVDFDEDGLCGVHYHVAVNKSAMQIVALSARLHRGNAVRITPISVVSSCHRLRAKRPSGTRRRVARRTSGCRSPGRSSSDDGPEPPLVNVDAAAPGCMRVGSRGW